jgi:hypothetical protein
MRKLPVLLLSLALATFALASKPRALRGDAVVRSIGEDRIAVLLDTNDDQNIDQGFLLTSDLPVTSTGARCPTASVEFTDSYVRVRYESKVWDLYVAGYPEPPAVPMDTTKFIGYALQHSSGDSGCNMERAMSDAGVCFGYGKE